MWSLAVVWSLLHAVDAALGPCAAYWYDDSSSGTPGWQWFPPGFTCTYRAEDSDAITVITRPGLEYVALSLLLVAFPLAAAARRLMYRDQVVR
jgi:hypothetical protein